MDDMSVILVCLLNDEAEEQYRHKLLMKTSEKQKRAMEAAEKNLLETTWDFLQEFEKLMKQLEAKVQQHLKVCPS